MLRELKPEDIRGLNEHVLTAEEKEIYRHTRELAGLSADTPLEEEPDTLINIPTTLVDPRQVGDGKRTLSWIWYTVSEGELDGSVVHDSKFVC